MTLTLLKQFQVATIQSIYSRECVLLCRCHICKNDRAHTAFTKTGKKFVTSSEETLLFFLKD